MVLRLPILGSASSISKPKTQLTYTERSTNP
jgi:hypothetical protein